LWTDGWRHLLTDISDPPNIIRSTRRSRPNDAVNCTVLLQHNKIRCQTTSPVAPLAASQAKSHLLDGITDVQGALVLIASIPE